MASPTGSFLRLFPDLVLLKIFEHVGSGVWALRGVCRDDREIVMRLTTGIRMRFKGSQVGNVLQTLRSTQSIQRVDVTTLRDSEDLDLTELAELLGTPALRSLSITDFALRSTWQMPWHTMVSLEALVMRGGISISTADLELLTSLRSLHLLNDCAQGDTIPMTDIFKKTMLTSLALSWYEGVIPEGFLGVGALSLLQSLHLQGGNNEKIGCMRSLSALSALTGLTHLALHDVSELQSTDFLTTLTRLKSLSMLSMGYQLLSEPSFRSNLSLESLDLDLLRNYGVDWLHVSDLTCLSNLTQLQLGSTFMNTLRKKKLDISPLTTLTALRTLVMRLPLSCASHGDYSAAQVAMVRALTTAVPALKVLDIVDNIVDLTLIL